MMNTDSAEARAIRQAAAKLRQEDPNAEPVRFYARDLSDLLATVAYWGHDIGCQVEEDQGSLCECYFSPALHIARAVAGPE